MTRLGVVLATVDDLPLAAGLARAAVARRLAVRVFAMHAGVRALAADRAAVTGLADDGVELIACATSADAAGVDLAALGVAAGSQDDHAALCAWADRVVAFA